MENLVDDIKTFTSLLSKYDLPDVRRDLDAIAYGKFIRILRTLVDFIEYQEDISDSDSEEDDDEEDSEV